MIDWARTLGLLAALAFCAACWAAFILIVAGLVP